MRVLANEQHTLLRLQRGEELIATVQEYAAAEDLRYAVLAGIGALEDVELGYFRLATKSYDRRRLEGQFELTSLVGNLAWVDDRPFLHAHVTLAGPDYGVVGGHLFAGRVSVTAELCLWTAPADAPRLRRVEDAETGLRLWELPGGL